MRVLMLGWEFPPHFSGGLGVVCYELTKALSYLGVKTTYIMPFGPNDLKADFVDLIIANNLLKNPNIKIKKIPAMLTPYITSGEYEHWYRGIFSKGDPTQSLYSPTLFQEVNRFSELVELIARDDEYDLIHAHDWLTFLAGIRLKKATGKPLIVHIHATEFDRTGDGGVNQYVYDIERQGMHEANLVLAVSQRIKDRCIHQYGVPAEKVKVLYNAVSLPTEPGGMYFEIKKKDKIVLFLGRITLQKGPDYFVEAARKVIDMDPNVKFVMAGSGDMMARMIQRSAEMGMGSKMIFPGFVSRQQAEKLFQMADVFVMPSVSEPFGIVPLEAMSQDTPVIISKQSGVAEIIRHCIKVDFWDVNDIAEKILSVLNYKNLHSTLKQHGATEVGQIDWNTTAAKCLNIYREVL